MRSWPFVLFVLGSGLLGSGCARPTGTRDLRVEGLPTCPKGQGYARAVVVRVDRERSLFDEPYSKEVRLEAPGVPPVFAMPRGRLQAIVRVGTCTPTSLGTWDCKAATWLSTQQIALDGGQKPWVLHVPPVAVGCAR